MTSVLRRLWAWIVCWWVSSALAVACAGTTSPEPPDAQFYVSQLTIVGDGTYPPGVLGWKAGILDYNDGIPLPEVVRIIQHYVTQMRDYRWYDPVFVLKDTTGHTLTIDWTVPEHPTCRIEGPLTPRAQMFLVAIGCRWDNA